jgi:branched-chain amino acid transport system substrate-binding protein
MRQGKMKMAKEIKDRNKQDGFSDEVNSFEHEEQYEAEEQEEEEQEQKEEQKEEQEEKRKSFIPFVTAFFAVALIAVVLTLFWQSGFIGFLSSYSKKPFYIAVSGPMSGKSEINGQAMVKGVQLYLDKINQQGGIHGHPVKLLTFDDQNQPELAEKKALEIAKDSQALAVIGHYGSSTSLAAAPIYQKYGIPAVSGSATANELTQNNDWYFRTIFNNTDQGELLANYVHKVLKKVLNYDQVNILFDEDAYGSTLSAAFTQKAKKIGLDIKHQWHYNSADSFNNTLKKLIETLKASPNKQYLLFLATHSTEAVETLVALKQLKNVRINIVGGDALSSTSFLQKFKHYPQEQSQPGYYSNGVYTVSPLLSSLSGEHAQDFGEAFVKKYQKEPMSTSALYYDAAAVVLDAMRRELEQEKESPLSVQRQRIKEGLWYLAKTENAIEGVTSPLYFDQNGDAIKPMPIGIYNHGKAIAAMHQFQPLQSVQNINNLLQDMLESQIIEVNGKFMSLAKVVYVGIDFNEISELKPDDSTFMADFYLWFRFKSEFDDTNIEFVNIATDEVLEEPVSVWYSSVEPGITTKTYRFKSQFKVALDFHNYPLDQQILPISFRHKELTKNQLIYVVDVQGMAFNPAGKSEDAIQATQKFFSMSGWYINRASFFQNTRVNDSTWGIVDYFGDQQRIEFSQFNAIITISRYILNFILKTLLPVLFLVVLGYVAFYLSDFSQKLAIGTNLILATSLFHLQLASELSTNYIVLIEHFFYLVYLLAVFIILIAVFMHRCEEDESEKGKQFVKRLNLAGKILYPLALLIFVGIIVYNNYHLF